MTAIVITLFSFFLEATCSLYIKMTHPTFAILFTMISVIVGYSYFHNRKNYYLYCGIVGLCYDMATGTLGMHTILFCTCGYLFQKSFGWLSHSWYNFLIILFVTIVLYRVFSYSILLITGYLSPDIYVFLQILIASILPNLFYGFLLYQLQHLMGQKSFLQKKF